MKIDMTTPIFEKSEQINEIAAALAIAQAVIVQPAKTKKASLGKYSYNYCDLSDVIAACRRPLSDQGIAFVQSPYVHGNIVWVTTLLMHQSGQWISCSLSAEVSDNRPQTLGSAITYLRRYSLSPMVGIAPDEDDDAQTAQGTSPQPPPSAPPPRVEPKPEKPKPAQEGQPGYQLMVAAFKNLGVTQQMLEKDLGHPVMFITSTEKDRLRKIYDTIVQGGGSADQFFPDFGSENPANK